MITAICILILYCLITGKNPEKYVRRIKNIDWQSYISKIFSSIKVYALKAGRIATRPILQSYYVLQDDKTPTTEKAMIYGCLLYIVLPFSLIPRAAHKFLGMMDEGIALVFVIKQINDKLTPEINAKVDETLNEWFGTVCENVD